VSARIARAAVLLVGLLIVAGAVAVAVWLGTASKDDEQQMEKLMGALFAGFQEQDVAKLAGVFSTTCGDMTVPAQQAIDQLYLDAKVVEFRLVGVDIRNLEDDTAEVLPQGSITIDGQESPIAGADEEFTPVVKEDGKWKVAACDLFD
jgi:hypothetical protein